MKVTCPPLPTVYDTYTVYDRCIYSIYSCLPGTPGSSCCQCNLLFIIRTVILYSVQYGISVILYIKLQISHVGDGMKTAITHDTSRDRFVRFWANQMNRRTLLEILGLSYYVSDIILQKKFYCRSTAEEKEEKKWRHLQTWCVSHRTCALTPKKHIQRPSPLTIILPPLSYICRY
jgi:hypothetical protein